VKLLTEIEDLEITKMKIIIKDYFKELNTLPVFIDRKFIDINQNMK
jgi:orotidine-5'-phosphate decarboxylase